MSTLSVYFIKVNMVFIAFFAMYYFLFRQMKFLVVNRVVLGGGLVAAFLLPLLPGMPVYFSSSRVFGPEVLASGVGEVAGGGISTGEDGCAWIYLLMLAVYGGVTGFFLIRLIYRLYVTVCIIKGSERECLGGITICEPEGKVAPFSFFRYVVVRRDDWGEEIYQQVLLHERAHSRQLHSIDILAAELACGMLWVNPLVWIFRRQVNLQLEYLADESVIAAGCDRRSYQLALLGVVTGVGSGNGFYTPKIKHRIGMMNMDLPARRQLGRYLLLLPLGMMLSIVAGSRARGAEGMQGRIFVDAQTENVRFSLKGPMSSEKFSGIYVVGGTVYSADAMRQKILATGEFVVRFRRRPMLGIYSSNDATAIRKWGEQARKGVIFVVAPGSGQ